MRYAMNTDPSTWPNAAEERREAAEHAYINSERLISDALDWVGGHGHEHAKLLEHIIDYYVESKQFATMVDDIADGAVEL